jgi:hypothetical protein
MELTLEPTRRSLPIKLAVLAAGVCALVLALTPLASGHKVKYPTGLQLKIDSVDTATAQYSGKVSSTRGACVVARTINVSANGVLLATTFSNIAGDWNVTGPKQAKGTEVTAFTPKKILKKNRKHRHKCAAALNTRKAPGP